LRALAVTSAKRLPVLPDLPTVAESGVPGFEAASWYGALLPAGVPAAVVTTLNREMVKAIRTADVRERLESDGAEVVGSTPDAFAQYLKNDIERWRKLAPALDLR
jgi:tripartite-type tricarboxylate transporter receptor subunit TctC